MICTNVIVWKLGYLAYCGMDFELRTALDSDQEAITELIAASAHGLGPPYYSTAQTEAALRTSFGVDSQLIRDRTYFAVMHGEMMVGCGGWSYRETLFGSDREADRSPNPVDPATGAARIRAFFVRPEYARRGVGSLILQQCEEEAWRRGFRKLELMATLSGIAFYRKHGFVPAAPISHRLNDDLTIQFVPMSRKLLR